MIEPAYGSVKVPPLPKKLSDLLDFNLLTWAKEMFFCICLIAGMTFAWLCLFMSRLCCLFVFFHVKCCNIFIIGLRFCSLIYLFFGCWSSVMFWFMAFMMSVLLPGGMFYVLFLNIAFCFPLRCFSCQFVFYVALYCL